MNGANACFRSRATLATLTVALLALTCPTHAFNKVTEHPTAMIKNIIIYQLGGWRGLVVAHPNRDFDWPASGGMSAYLGRNPEILQHQMSLIADLGPHVAVGVLLMTDADSAASGYGTCWDGSWSGGLSCDSGTFTHPFAMYDHVRAAARAAGLRYVPDFSLMNYDGARGAAVLQKLKKAIAWWRTRLPDPFAGTSRDGRFIVVVDSLPRLDGFTEADRAALLDYMQLQTDILWIDNLVNDDAHPDRYASSDNIYRSAAADEDVQSALAARDRDHYLWWFAANLVLRSAEPVRLKLLNIKPHHPGKYPVMISQWNEYAGNFVFEPSQKVATKSYDYLKLRLSQQP